MSLNSLISQFSRYAHRLNDVDVAQICGLAEGTTVHTLKTTIQIYYNVYNLSGLIYPITDNIAMTACAQQAVSTFCYYLVSVDANQVVTVTKGTDNTYSLPATPSGTVAMGAFLI